MGTVPILDFGMLRAARGNGDCPHFERTLSELVSAARDARLAVLAGWRCHVRAHHLGDLQACECAASKGAGGHPELVPHCAKLHYDSAG